MFPKGKYWSSTSTFINTTLILFVLYTHADRWKRLGRLLSDPSHTLLSFTECFTSNIKGFWNTEGRRDDKNLMSFIHNSSIHISSAYQKRYSVKMSRSRKNSRRAVSQRRQTNNVSQLTWQANPRAAIIRQVTYTARASEIRWESREE